jgi:DNA-directed RNA polymerase subunit RPC12/RpoP
MLNSTTVERYFVDLHKLLTENKLHNKPSHIFNMDETGIQLEHAPTSVLARKGMKAVPGRVSNSRENITVVACVSADGKTLPPLVIAKGKTNRSLAQFQRQDAPEGSIFTYSEKAWMNDSIGSEWFSKVFLKQCGDTRPVLLILDGHHSHEALNVLEAAIKHDVEILCLPPHTTHYLQPLDRTVFGPLMKAYNRACTEYMASDPRHVVSKASWSWLFKEAWNSAVTKENIVSGFKACGIFPYNPATIPKKAYQPSTSWKPQTTAILIPDMPAAEVPPSTHSVEPSTSQEVTLSGLEAASPDVEQSNIAATITLGETPADSSWTEAVDSVFELQPVTIIPKEKKSRMITSHRVLTSSDYVQQKRDSEEERSKTKAGGKRKGSRHVKESDENEYLCAVCSKLYKKTTTLPWVQCDACDLWMHFKCIPAELASDDILEDDVPFQCHLH